ncbi:hypothetical protein, partial [Roseomonas rosulenta]|uniref:hypothetical protein n=1 Tax=Roseomonas rosulenta TaxID=2748667 RepID=UPI001E4AD81E
MRVIPVAFLFALAAAPVLAQGAGSLPPPVPVPSPPSATAPNDAAPARQPGMGQRPEEHTPE